MNIALILSGGTGTRLGGDIPKQYIEVDGRIVLSYCFETIVKCKKIDGVWIAAAEQWHDVILRCVEKYDGEKKFKGFSKPGENRQLSIFNGLCDIRSRCSEQDYVLVHDAARPLLTAELLERCLDGAVGHDGAMPVLPMKDTVYLSRDGRSVSGLLNRSEIYAGQAPEVFAVEKYYEANVRLMPQRIYEINGSTEPAVMAGMDIAMIRGDEGNYKITTVEDLARFRESRKRDKI